MTKPGPLAKKSFQSLAADTAAMVLIDHQVGIIQGVHDYSQVEFRNNVLALAKIARIFNLPTIVTSSAEEGPNGPLMPELGQLLPKATMIVRPGQISAWNDPNFVTAVEQTGRRQLIMAGVTTDVALTFPALSAVAAGYEVFAVIDASGTWNESAHDAATMRMSQSGVIVTNWVAIASELQQDWRKPTGQELARLFSEHRPFYGYRSPGTATSSRYAQAAE